MKLKITTYLTLPLAFLSLVASNKLDPNNPPAGRTGAPGEATCQASGCHSGGSFTGTIELTGVPDTVMADQSYSLTLTNTSDAVRSGFQLTALNSANAKVGTLTTGPGTSITSAGGRQYIRQSSPHNLANGSTSWTFTWKAPSAVVGDSIFFYFTSLCANGNGNDNGDNVLKNKKAVVLPEFVSVAKDKNPSFSLNFYPNPSMDYAVIEIPGKGSIEVLDEAGQLVIKSEVINSKKLDLSKLNPGVYFSKVALNGTVQTRVFIKN